MKRNTWNFIVDFLAFLSMLGLVFTGILIYYILPPGTRGGGGHLTLGGWNRHDFGNLHFYLAVVLIVLMLIHVWLHWAWVCTTIKGMQGSARPGGSGRIIAGVIFLVVLAVLLVGSLWLARSAVKGYGLPREHESHETTHPEKVHGESEEHGFGEQEITGRTSLAQAAELAGVGVQRLIEELKLPADTDPQTNLGPLRRTNEWDLYEVRELVEQLRRQHQK